MINPSWFIIAVLTSAIPIPLLKKYNETSDPKYIMISSILFLVLILAYVNLLRNSNMIAVYPFVKISSIILVTITGVLIFSNKLTPKIAIGLVLGLISLYLLNSNTEPIIEVDFINK